MSSSAATPNIIPPLLPDSPAAQQDALRVTSEPYTTPFPSIMGNAQSTSKHSHLAMDGSFAGIDTPPSHTRQQPPAPVPFAESNNSDAIALRAALSVLHIQRQQALRDMRTLEQIKDRALSDPQVFTEALKKGEISSRRQDGAILSFDDGDEDSANEKKTETTEPVKEEEQSSPPRKRRKGRKPANGTTSKPTAAQDTKEKEGPVQKPFARLPAPQNIIRTPPINWAKYHIVGPALDKMHEDERRNPTEGQPEGWDEYQAMTHQLKVQEKQLHDAETTEEGAAAGTQVNGESKKEQDEDKEEAERIRLLMTRTRKDEAVVAAPYDPWKDELILKPGPKSAKKGGSYKKKDEEEVEKKVTDDHENEEDEEEKVKASKVEEDDNDDDDDDEDEDEDEDDDEDDDDESESSTEQNNMDVDIDKSQDEDEDAYTTRPHSDTPPQKPKKKDAVSRRGTSRGGKAGQRGGARTSTTASTSHNRETTTRRGGRGASRQARARGRGRGRGRGARSRT